MKELSKPQAIEIAHLLICKKCHHSCKLCCNKFYNLEEIPVISVEELKTIHTLCITGGEPLLIGSVLIHLLTELKKQYPNIENIYVYTSCDGLESFPLSNLCSIITGLTISPKNDNDYINLISCSDHYNVINRLPSNRLYVFEEQTDTYNNYKKFLDNLNAQVLYRKWNKTSITPNNEIFRRLPILLN